MLSVLALVCGLVIGLLSVWQQLVASAYAWLLGVLIWSDPFLGALHWSVAVVVCLPPYVFLGMAASCLNHIGEASNVSRVTRPWLCIGSAVGAGLASWMLAEGIQPYRVQMAAALPILCVAVVASIWDAAGAQPDHRAVAREAIPLRRDHHPRSLRVAILLVDVSALLAVVSWVESSGLGGVIPLAVVLASTGFGSLLGSAHGRVTAGAGRVFGQGCIVAAILLAAGATQSIIPAVAGAAALGWAGSLGWASLFGQAAGRAVSGRLFPRVLFACSCAALAAPACIRLLGPGGVLGSLSAVVFIIGAGFALEGPKSFRRIARPRKAHSPAHPSITTSPSASPAVG